VWCVAIRPSHKDSTRSQVHKFAHQFGSVDQNSAVVLEDDQELRAVVQASGNLRKLCTGSTCTDVSYTRVYRSSMQIAVCTSHEAISMQRPYRCWTAS
jgi:alpha-ketoglutarate-dependent taurine dioxygenase